MSKIIPIKSSYEKPILTLCQIFRLALRDGTVLGFTSFDQDIALIEEPNVIYKANSGMTPSAVSASAKFAVDNLDVEGFLEDARITESDIQAGRYDFADVLIAELDWAIKPYTNQKLHFKRVGKIGEIRIDGGKFIAEIRGLMQSLQNNIGDLYQTSCRSMLGSPRCGVDINPFMHDSTVLQVTNNRTIRCNLEFASDYFDNGKILFMSGLNINLSCEIKSWDSATKTFELHLPANYVININDTFKAIAGCPGLIEICHSRFSNAKRFDGEPYIPQSEALIRT